MPIIGLDLGKYSFRAIEIDERRGKKVLTGFGTYENPRLDLNSAEKEGYERYAKSIRGFFSEVGFTTPNVVLGLEETSVFMRIIKVPIMNDKDLAKSIHYEAEQYIPLPLNKVNLSFQKLGVDPKDKERMHVQIVAAKKETLNNQVEIVRKANLVPKAIEPQSLAMNRSLLSKSGGTTGTVVLDVGYSGTFIMIEHKGHVRFTRTLPFGGDTITKSLQQGLKIDYLQAEEHKRVYGMDPSHFDGKVSEIIKPVINDIIMELKRASIFFTNNNHGVNIKRVIISGGTSLMPGFLSYLADNVDFEVELANPLKGLEISPKLAPKENMLLEAAPMYSVAVGLALRRI